jgi:hypothetical protein
MQRVTFTIDDDLLAGIDAFMADRGLRQSLGSDSRSCSLGPVAIKPQHRVAIASRP